MSVDAAEALLTRALAPGKWPHPSEEPILKALNTWVAIRESNSDVLRQVSGWTDARRRYRVDPLGERIADAWAHYLFGQEPIITTADVNDAPLLTDLAEANALDSELERAAVLCVSEGEIWPRIYVDEVAADHPLVDWVSRRNVFPLWVGSRLASAAIVTELPAPANAAKGTVFRHFEVHAPGVVLNALFVGKDNELGERRPLDEHEQTAELDEVWEHNMRGMLLGRIPNRLRGDRRLGVSDYAGILDFLLDLNEAAIIGSSNMRLTARQRLVASAAVLRPRERNDLELTPEENPSGTVNPPAAQFDAAEEVFVEDPLDKELGRETRDPIRVVGYDFNASALIEWKRELVATALTRVGLTAQYAGVETNEGVGYAISGTALRLRLIPTDSTGRGKARYWTGRGGYLPRVIAAMAQLDSAPQGGRGFDRGWNDPTDPPTIERRPGLPVDEAEQTETHARAVESGILSLETSLRERFPGRDENWYADEVQRIRDDKGASAAAGGGMFPAGA